MPLYEATVLGNEKFTVKKGANAGEVREQLFVAIGRQTVTVSTDFIAPRLAAVLILGEFRTFEGRSFFQDGAKIMLAPQSLDELWEGLRSGAGGKAGKA